MFKPHCNQPCNLQLLHAVEEIFLQLGPTSSRSPTWTRSSCLRCSSPCGNHSRCGRPAADWPRRAEARGSPGARSAAERASGAPTGRGLSQPLFSHIGSSPRSSSQLPAWRCHASRARPLTAPSHTPSPPREPHPQPHRPHSPRGAC
eukprot:scaffold74423_cov45-Phaeocystis_antarctica.AAC.1